MALSPREMQAAIVRNLPERTGRTLEAWVREVRAHGPTLADRSLRAARTAWLKQHHGLGHIQAQVIAAHAEDAGGAYEDGDALLTTLFAPGSASHALFEQVVRLVRATDGSVEVVPCRTYVGLRAGLPSARQFAVLKPLRTRGAGGGIDDDALLMGLAFSPESLPTATDAAIGTQPAKARRGLGGSARITHELLLRSSADVYAAQEWIMRARGSATVTADARRSK